MVGMKAREDACFAIEQSQRQDSADKDRGRPCWKGEAREMVMVKEKEGSGRVLNAALKSQREAHPRWIYRVMSYSHPILLFFQTSSLASEWSDPSGSLFLTQNTFDFGSELCSPNQEVQVCGPINTVTVENRAFDSVPYIAIFLSLLCHLIIQQTDQNASQRSIKQNALCRVIISD